MAYRKSILLKLGMVSTLVDLESAAETERPLKTVCDDGHQPTAIKQTSACPECGNADWSTFKRARVEGKSEFTVVDTDELAAARNASIGTTKDAIELTVHPVSQVREGTIQGKGSSYYLTSSKSSLVPVYAAMADILKRHPDKAFIGAWTPVSRPGLYELRLHGEATLVLSPLEWAENVKVVAQPSVTIPEENQKQLDALVTNAITDFDASTYQNTFQANLEALLATKTAEEGVLGEKAARTSVPTGTVDLTAILDAALSGKAA